MYALLSSRFVLDLGVNDRTLSATSQRLNEAHTPPCLKSKFELVLFDGWMVSLRLDVCLIKSQLTRKRSRFWDPALCLASSREKHTAKPIQLHILNIHHKSTQNPHFVTLLCDHLDLFNPSVS